MYFGGRNDREGGAIQIRRTSLRTKRTNKTGGNAYEKWLRGVGFRNVGSALGSLCKPNLKIERFSGLKRKYEFITHSLITQSLTKEV